jgi:L-alanine-DL-glutamate epimerase-like enolase superfamily enzyme
VTVQPLATLFGAGFRALKIRIDRHAMADGLATVRATREAVGDTHFVLAAPLAIDGEGRLNVPRRPGLGIELSDEAVRAFDAAP